MMKTMKLGMPQTTALKPQSMAVVTLAAIGVVWRYRYQPQYTMKEVFALATGSGLTKPQHKHF
jgi:hypothetical protein